MMLAIRHILLLLLLSGLSLWSSQLAGPELGKLSKNQQQHLAIYRQIQVIVQSGKTNHKKIFSAYYTFVNNCNKNDYPKNKKQADLLMERANQALVAGKVEMAGKLEKAANLYAAMAQANQDIINAFEKVNSAKMRQGIAAFLTVEEEMKKLKLKTLTREWLTADEAEKLLLAQAQQNRR